MTNINIHTNKHHEKEHEIYCTPVRCCFRPIKTEQRTRRECVPSDYNSKKTTIIFNKWVEVQKGSFVVPLKPVSLDPNRIEAASWSFIDNQWASGVSQISISLKVCPSTFEEQMELKWEMLHAHKEAERELKETGEVKGWLCISTDPEALYKTFWVSCCDLKYLLRPA